MRVRYQMVGKAEVAVCDLSEKKARKMFDELKAKGLCEWAELVGEDDDNYMDVLESFDHIKMARMVNEVMMAFRGV